MKPINQERIRQTIQSIERHRDRVLAPTRGIIHQATLTGLKSAMGADTRTDMQKLGLEFDFASQPKNLEAAESIMSEMMRNVERFSARMKKVHQVQERHNISGLVPSSIQLGDRTLPIMEEDEDLALVPSDLDVLRSQKPKIVDLFLNCLHSFDELELYVDMGSPEYWVKHSVSPRPVTAFYDWAIVWESIHYVSPSKMRSRGYDSPRLSPELADDEKRWEIHLWLGCGLDLHGPEQSLTYCASNVIPAV